jgi:hypothetical protein
MASVILPAVPSESRPGRFGVYGGRYVPETLMAALVELEHEYEAAKNDAAFQAELAGLLKDYAGRPTPLYFAKRLTELGLHYVLGMQSTTTVWPPARQPLPAPIYSGRGRPASRVRRDPQHAPTSATQLALALPSKAWKTVAWREGTRRPLRSRFAAVRIRPAHRDHKLQQPRERERLLIEWPGGETEPRK